MADTAPIPATAGAAAPEHTYKFNVTMTCGGCSGAVDRVLKRLDGNLFPAPPFSHLLQRWWC